MSRENIINNFKEIKVRFSLSGPSWPTHYVIQSIISDDQMEIDRYGLNAHKRQNKKDSSMN